MEEDVMNAYTPDLNGFKIYLRDKYYSDSGIRGVIRSYSNNTFYSLGFVKDVFERQYGKIKSYSEDKVKEFILSGELMKFKGESLNEIAEKVHSLMQEDIECLEIGIGYGASVTQETCLLYLESLVAKGKYLYKQIKQSNHEA